LTCQEFEELAECLRVAEPRIVSLSLSLYVWQICP